MSYFRASFPSPMDSQESITAIAQDFIRHSVLTWNILFSFLIIPAGILIAYLLPYNHLNSHYNLILPLLFSTMLTLVLLAYFIMIFALWRLYEHHFNGGFILLSLVPLLNFLTVLYLIFSPRNLSALSWNRFQSTRNWENILAILYVLFVVLVTVTVFMVPTGSYLL